jgi:hypothetical protein
MGTRKELEEVKKIIPHQAVILVKAEIMERLPNGKVSGIPKKIISKIYTVMSDSYIDCVKNTNEFINNINNGDKNTNGPA